MYRECIIITKEHGFERKRSNITNLLTCVHIYIGSIYPYRIKELDNKQPVDVAYFERAFYKVSLDETVDKYFNDITFKIVSVIPCPTKAYIERLPQGLVLFPAYLKYS